MNWFDGRKRSSKAWKQIWVAKEAGLDHGVLEQ